MGIQLRSLNNLMMEEKDSHPISFLVTEDQSPTVYSKRFKATYHSTHGAISETKHVYIKHGLQYLHQHLQVEDLSVLEIGFGTGLNAFLTYLYAHEKQVKINYHTLEAYPVNVYDACKLNYARELSDNDKAVFDQLHLQSWNETQQISDFFSFTKHLGLAEYFVIQRKFELIYFDAFSPSEQPELWTELVFKNMFDLLEEQGVLVTYCAQGQMKRNMKAAGFKVKALSGFGIKREMTRAEKL
ncbi:MAG: tRNA (5-methylaminomethyl-2-thiouridine)(34)-methyltransferase MnmD [Bacteroidota bacterium]